MSILHTFRKLVDPDVARLEEVLVKVERERPRDEEDGGEPPARYRCRVCHHESADPAYCPRCLAETMRRVDETGEDQGA